MKPKYSKRWMKPKYSKSVTVAPLAAQLNEADSLYNHYKRLIHFRKSNAVIGSFYGQIEPLPNRNPRLVVFKRRLADQEVWVLHNLSSTTVTYTAPFMPTEVLLSTEPASCFEKVDVFSLAPFSCVVLGE